MRALLLGVATLALFAGAASAQVVYPGYGYPPYGYGYAGYGYGLYDYAGYGYAPSAYGAPATAGTTVIIVTPGTPAYTAPPVVGSGYYNYAPGYWGGGYGRAGYWWR